MNRKSLVFSPVSLRAYTLSNRIVMSSPSRMRAVNGVPRSMMVTYYAQRASAGLIISEPTLVSPTTPEYSNCPGIYNYEQILAWRKVTKAVRDRGGKIFLQLWYGEGISPLYLEQKYYDFKVDSPGKSRSQLQEIVLQLRKGAQNALAAEFDGVEINGALGYILDRYLPLNPNLSFEENRADRERRTDIFTDIVDAVGSVWDCDRVGIRLYASNLYNGNSHPDPEPTFYYLIDALNFFNLAYVHLITPPRDKSFLVSDYDLITDIFRPIYRGTIIIEGEDNPKKAIHAIDKGDTNLISFSRSFIANPDLPQRLQENAPLNAIDSETIYGGDEKGYIDYPFL